MIPPFAHFCNTKQTIMHKVALEIAHFRKVNEIYGIKLKRPPSVTQNMMAMIRLLFLSPFLLLLLSCTSDSDRPDSLAVNIENIEWGEPGDGSIAPAGTRTSLQSTEPNTGGISYYAWFPAGGFFDLHWHTYDEYVVVIRGEVTFTLGENVYDLEPGAYVVIPGGMQHSWDIPESDDAVIMVKRMGPPDFHFVDR